MNYQIYEKQNKDFGLHFEILLIFFIIFFVYLFLVLNIQFMQMFSIPKYIGTTYRRQYIRIINYNIDWSLYLCKNTKKLIKF